MSFVPEVADRPAEEHVNEPCRDAEQSKEKYPEFDVHLELWQDKDAVIEQQDRNFRKDDDWRVEQGIRVEPLIHSANKISFVGFATHLQEAKELVDAERGFMLAQSPPVG